MAFGQALTLTAALLLQSRDCELEVKVKRKGMDVHARRGSYYEAR